MVAYVPFFFDSIQYRIYDLFNILTLYEVIMRESKTNNNCLNLGTERNLLEFNR
jgi:hypothetical protein